MRKRALIDTPRPRLTPTQEQALREELLLLRERLQGNVEAQKAPAYRMVRELFVSLGDDEGAAPAAKPRPGEGGAGTELSGSTWTAAQARSAEAPAEGDGTPAAGEAQGGTRDDSHPHSRLPETDAQRPAVERG